VRPTILRPVLFIPPEDGRDAMVRYPDKTPLVRYQDAARCIEKYTPRTAQDGVVLDAKIACPVDGCLSGTFGDIPSTDRHIWLTNDDAHEAYRGRDEFVRLRTKRTSPPRDNTCEICGKSFSRDFALQRHQQNKATSCLARIQRRKEKQADATP